MVRSSLLLLGIVVFPAWSCDSPVESQCHRDVVERHGCCPSCDAECRAALSQECAGVHDEPLPVEQATVGEGSTGEDPDDDEPTPPG